MYAFAVCMLLGVAVIVESFFLFFILEWVIMQFAYMSVCTARYMFYYVGELFVECICICSKCSCFVVGVMFGQDFYCLGHLWFSIIYVFVLVVSLFV